jgi:PPOX class probable F420-dependent enzyme
VADLTDQERNRLEEFLAPPRIAVVATVGKTGMPQLTPNWYEYRDGRMTVSTTKDRIKYKNLARDDRLAVCVYSDTLPHDYVTVRGRAQIIEGDAIWPDTLAIVKRYVTPDKVEARMSALRKQPRIIISLEPDQVHFNG